MTIAVYVGSQCRRSLGFHAPDGRVYNTTTRSRCTVVTLAKPYHHIRGGDDETSEKSPWAGEDSDG